MTKFIEVGDSFTINTQRLSTKGVVTKINRKTLVYDAPYMVCPGAPDGWLRGLRIDLADLEEATILHSTHVYRCPSLWS